MNTSLPKQVQAQIDKAEQLHKEIVDSQTAGSNPPEAVDSTPATQPSEVVQTVEPVVESKPVDAKAETGKPSYEELEQKFKSLQGMFNPMAQKYQGEIRQLQAQLEQNVWKIQQLEQQLAQKAESNQKFDALVKPEEVEEYGAEFMDVVGRKAQEATYEFRQRAEQAEAVAKQLSDRLAQLESVLGNVQERQGSSDQERFNVSLSHAAPGWEDLNTNEGFLMWLADRAPGTRFTRQQLLSQAYTDGDVETVAFYFNEYSGANSAAKKDAKRNERVAGMAQQAAPRTSGNGQSSSTGTAKVWTPDEIKKFYSDSVKGRYSVEESARIEQEIFKAQQESRIAA